MIKRKEKYETPQFTFWLTEYSEDSHYDYDIIFASQNVSPSATKNDLEGLAKFIQNFIDNK